MHAAAFVTHSKRACSHKHAHLLSCCACGHVLICLEMLSSGTFTPDRHTLVVRLLMPL